MSILIRDIDMPKNCLECPCFQFEWFDDYIDGCCNALKIKIENSHQYLPNCPLIELSSHGDLVDLSDMVHPNDSMRLMTINEQLGRTCEGWSVEKENYVVIKAKEEM